MKSDPTIIVFEELDSTSAEARRRALSGETGPLWLMARVQSAGRGRRGRVWQTGGGNLAATLLLTLDTSPLEAAQLGFVAALAVGDMVQAYVPPAMVRLKWPNDVLIDGQKVAGILIESGPAQMGALWVSVGIGVNLASAPANVDHPAIALADDPILMARAMKAGVEAGRLAHRAGRIPRINAASPSSPTTGLIR